MPNRKGYGKVGKRKAAFQLSHSHDYYEIPSVMGYGFKGQVQQALHLLALDPVAETTADKNSYGFRQQRSCADAIQQCFNALRVATTQWILEGDIKSCFDEISHDWLLAHVPMDWVILQKWLKTGYMEKHVLHETTEGTPQGGIISAALANRALDGLERVLREKYPSRTRLKSLGDKLPSLNFIRSADDFISTSKSKELLEREIKPLVEQFLQKRGLELSPTKTVITHVEKGFDFLGQNVRRYPNGKLLIKPSKKNVKTFEPVPGRELHLLKSSAFSRRTISPTIRAVRRRVGREGPPGVDAQGW